jgi:hypothetical protein
MADPCVPVTVEVHQRGNGLLVSRPLELRLLCDDGLWHAECDSPRVHTVVCDTMAEAVAQGTRQAEEALQAEVFDRPVIAGKITPDMVPPGMF